VIVNSCKLPILENLKATFVKKKFTSIDWSLWPGTMRL